MLEDIISEISKRKQQIKKAKQLVSDVHSIYSDVKQIDSNIQSISKGVFGNKDTIYNGMIVSAGIGLGAYVLYDEYKKSANNNYQPRYQKKA